MVSEDRQALRLDWSLRGFGSVRVDGGDDAAAAAWQRLARRHGFP